MIIIKGKKKNPLNKRILRELQGDWRKYLVVGLFLILMIGFVSGMYVANESMTKAISDGYSRYNLEDGHFELKNEADDKLINDIKTGNMADIKQYNLEDAEDKYELNNTNFTAVPVEVYSQFYRNEEEDNDNDGQSDGTIRVYQQSDNVNLACLLDGEFPENVDEVAIDRMHADNIGIEVGDTIYIGGKDYKVTGLIAYVNYATLHEKNTDMMFDALKFDVAMVTKDGFNRLTSQVHYSYAWTYQNTPSNEIEEKKLSDNFFKALITQSVMGETSLVDYLPRYENQAVQFAPDDIGSDKAMGGVLLDILIVVIAFIFAITIANTIIKESSAIGTLRASGYTKWELSRHYLAMPVIVTVIAAVIGNVLGYTVFKNIVVGMYYNSYSLPTYETVWNGSAFIKTTLIPLVIMIIINLIIIIKMMQHSALQFLRHDFKKSKRKKAIQLPNWKFFSRFRLRVMFQNIPNYIILFVGIFLVSVMLAMAVGMPDTLSYYKQNASDMMIAKYQYILKSYENDGDTITTKTENAEKFSIKSLIQKSNNLDEEVSVYGIADNSQYVKIDGIHNYEIMEVYISDSYQKKYGVKIGDTITLDEKYENKQYKFKVIGIYDKCQSISVFMSRVAYNSVFELKDEEFSGFFSNIEITDIKADNVATIVTEKDITKVCDQMDHSMGSYMIYFQILCILLSAVLIYLLTKIIIEKNENAISMAKILGYTNKEISSLYMISTTIFLIIADAVSVILGTLVMREAWKAILSSYGGWFEFVISPVGYIKIFAFVLVGYLIVMFFDLIRIKRIPMDEALKNVE